MTAVPCATPIARDHTPVLDEATSALSEGNEEDMYSAMREMGITAITVGHRSSLKKVLSGPSPSHSISPPPPVP